MDWLESLKELLNQQCSDFAQYKPLLLEMEEFWKQVKVYHNYIPCDSCIQLFEPADVRLKKAEEKLQKVKSNPACGMRELLQQVERNLRDWISDNQYGYLMEFDILETGYVKVKISGMLSVHASYGNKTKEEVYQEAIDKLKQEGFELCLGRNKIDHWFLDTDTNRDLIASKLTLINGAFLSFTSMSNMIKNERIIREYTFRTHISDLLQLTTKETKYRDVLNADDYRSLAHDLGEFVSAYSTVRQMPELTHTCLSVMEGIFANLCKMLNVETETSKEYYSRYEEERAKNQKIRNIEAEIATLANFKDFSKIIDDRLEPIRKKIEKHDFFLDSFFLDCYGRATLVLHQSRLGCDRFEGFETFPAFGRDDELEILDTESNKKKFEEFIPFFEVSNMELMVKDNRRCIRKVTYTCKSFI